MSFLGRPELSLPCVLHHLTKAIRALTGQFLPTEELCRIMNTIQNSFGLLHARALRKENGAREELERLVRKFADEVGDVEGYEIPGAPPDTLVGAIGAPADGAPAGGAVFGLYNKYKLVINAGVYKVVKIETAGGAAGGAAAGGAAVGGAAAGGAAASAAGARMNEPNPYTVLREEKEALRQERESLSSSLAAAGAAAGGAADVSDAQRKKRARLDKQNAARREQRAADKRQQDLELRRFRDEALGLVPDHVAAAGGAAASGAAAGGAAGVRPIHVTVKLWQESKGDSKLLNTYVKRDCDGKKSVTEVIAKSDHPRCKKPTGLFYNRSVHYVDSYGKRHAFQEQRPLSQVPSNNANVVILHVVVGPDAAEGGDARGSDDDLYN